MTLLSLKPVDSLSWNIVMCACALAVFCGRKHWLCFVIQIFANETLRTLCLCYKDISTEEFEAWSRKHKEAQVTMVNREAALDQVYEQIEKNLMVSKKTTTKLYFDK